MSTSTEGALLHFTSPERLAMIRAAGFLKVTESNIGSGRPDWPPSGEHVGPDVVWLTDALETTAKALGVESVQYDGTDKMAVRITVKVPDAEVSWWPDFAREHGIHRQWRRLMERGRDADSWWVIPRPVMLSEVAAIEHRPPGGWE